MLHKLATIIYTPHIGFSDFFFILGLSVHSILHIWGAGTDEFILLPSKSDIWEILDQIANWGMRR